VAKTAIKPFLVGAIIDTLNPSMGKKNLSELVTKGKVWMLFVLCGLIANGAFAGSPPEGVDFEFEDKIIQDGTQSLTRDDLEIRVSKDTSFKFSRTPDPFKMGVSLGLIDPKDLGSFATPGEKEELRKFGIEVDMESPANPLEEYEKFSAEEKEKFQSKRQEFLSMAAKALYHSRLVLGTGMLVGRSFKFIKAKLKGRDFELEPVKTLRDRKMQDILNALDYRLFQQAVLVNRANEFGVILSAGTVAVTGVKQTGLGGRLETGVVLAYNRDSKSFIIENIVSVEKFWKTSTTVAIVEVNFKGGVFLAYRDPGEREALRFQKSYYPPAVPFYTGQGQDLSTFGVTLGVGVPTSPFVQFMSYATSRREAVTVRIEASRLFTGLVRIRAGILSLETLKGFMERLRVALNRQVWHSCQNVF